MKRIFVAMTFVIMVSVPTITTAATLEFSDDFEGSSIDPFWRTYGNVSLSTERARSGTQSLKVSSGDVFHHFRPTVTGTLSAWFYDDLLPQDSNIAAISSGENAPTTVSIGAGISSQIPGGDEHYSYFNTSIPVSPLDSGVPRSPGWHKVVIAYDNNVGTCKIDNKLITASYWEGIDFDYAQLFNGGGTTYFDDFKCDVTFTSEPVPEPSTMMMGLTGLLGMIAFYRRKYFHSGR